MITLLVNLAGFISVLIYLLFTHAALTPGRSRLCCSLVILAEALISLLLRNLVNIFPILIGCQALPCYAIYLAAILFLYRDRIWKRILAWLLIPAVTSISEISAYAVLHAITGNAYAEILQFSYGYLIGVLIACAFESLLYSILLPIWRRVREQKPLKGIPPLFLLPAGQILIMFSCLSQLHGASYTSLSIWLNAAAQVFFFGADIFWLLWITERSNHNETALNLQAAQAAEAVQQEYFHNLEESNRAMAKLRHDYKNHLSTVSILLRNGKTEDAIAVIGELNDYLEQTRTAVWCSHAIVNAVLAKKSAECEAAGITPKFFIALPEELPVTPAQLSAVFANLLDNAIRGASESGSEEKSLQLKTECRAGYLFIITVNPSSAPEKPREDHGYGSVILREIAETYSGSYLTEYNDGIFRATVTLKLPEVKTNAAKSSSL